MVHIVVSMLASIYIQRYIVAVRLSVYPNCARCEYLARGFFALRQRCAKLLRFKLSWLSSAFIKCFYFFFFGKQQSHFNLNPLRGNTGYRQHWLWISTFHFNSLPRRYLLISIDIIFSHLCSLSLFNLVSTYS